MAVQAFHAIRAPMADQVALVDQINDLLERATDPFERRVLRSMLDVMPALRCVLERETGYGLPIQQYPDFTTSIASSVIATIASTLCASDERTSFILRKQVIMQLLADLTAERPR